MKLRQASGRMKSMSSHMENIEDSAASQQTKIREEYENKLLSFLFSPSCVSSALHVVKCVPRVHKYISFCLVFEREDAKLLPRILKMRDLFWKF